MKKIIGYVLAVLGIVILALAAIPPFREILNIPASFTSASLTLIGVLIIALAIVLLYFRTDKKGTEVPIYEGKKVVGYRRI